MAINKREIVNNYLEKWNSLENRTLARKIFEENPTIFNSIEDARLVIRTLKGAKGKHARKYVKDKQFYTENAKEKLTLEDIEEGIDEQETNFIFPTNLFNMLVISDIHTPYHNATALKEAIKYGKENKIDCLLINGDFIDFAPLSEYTKDPYTKMRLAKDIEEARKLLQILKNEFPDSVIYYKMGKTFYNPRTRIKRYYKKRQPSENPLFKDKNQYLSKSPPCYIRTHRK